MTNELTVRVQSPVIPAMSWNEEEVQKNLDEMLEAYTGRIYTPETIKGAKEDRAKVNAWNKQLGASLTAAKKLYMKPLEDFQGSIKKMQAQCAQVSGAIDTQVKAVEQAEREEKASSLRLVYRDSIGELEPLIPFERLLVPQWLNKTYDLSKATKDLRQAIENFRSDIETIRYTCGEDVEACTTEYLKDLNLNEAMNEHKSRQKSRAAQREAEAARIAAERARAAAPVFVQPTDEEREMKARAAAATQAKMFVTSEGRLDFGAMQEAAAEQLEPAAEPERNRYRFWVEFTQQDIEWFKKGAAERGFRFGPIK
jgi:hypothetical protein